MSNYKEGLNSILQAINNLITPQLVNLRYDKTFRGKVIRVIDKGLYDVQVNGVNYTLPYAGILEVGDIVKVKSPLNNFSDIYIEAIGGSGGGSGGSTNYNDLTNKPILNTNYTSSLAPNSLEILKGTIGLHKISKTGSYNDLNGLPSLDFIPNSEKGVAGGVATLGEDGQVVPYQLPAGIVIDGNYVHTDNNFTNALLTKLNGIEAGAQVNKIENIKVNGTNLPISNKTVEFNIPTKTSDLSNDGSDGVNPFISEIPIASETRLGAIIVGDNLSITEDGILSATGGGGGGSAVADTLPIGSVVEWFSNTIPTNWLLCNGQAVSRTTYSELFAKLGTTYGAGDGSTTFNLPNIKGRYIAGLDSNDPNFNSLGKTGGAVSQDIAHTHTINGHTHTLNNHTHTINSHTHTINSHTHTTAGHTLTTAEVPSHSHTRGSMEITGWLQTRPMNTGDDNPILGASGAFSVTKNLWSGAHDAFDKISISNKSRNDIDFNASKSWTGSTSSVGGNGSHSHGNTGGTSLTTNGTTLTTNSSNVNTSSTSLTTNQNTESTSVNTLSPYITGNYIVKAKQIIPITATVINNLSSTSTTDALSAYQGKILDDKISVNANMIDTLQEDIINIEDTLNTKLTVDNIIAGNNITINKSNNNCTINAIVPTNISELNNDSGFINNTVNNLTNYYLKSETYSQTEINNLIGQIKTVSIQVVSQLPTIGESNIIYFVPKEGSENDIYNEYIWINNKWELIGSTQVDLTGYATETWVKTQIKDFLTETEIQQLINSSLTNYYNKTEINGFLSNKLEESNITAGTNVTLDKNGNNIVINSTATPIDVIDNLTSTSKTSALSANQGRVLNGLIEGNANMIDTLQDDILALEDDVVDLKNNKIGTSNIKAGNNITVEVVGNDVTINSTGGGTGSEEVEISDTEPTNPDIKLWVDLTGSGEDPSGSVEVIDNLNSDSTTAALSANQGRILNNKISSNTTDINTIKTDVSTAKTDIININGNITDLSNNKSDRIYKYSFIFQSAVAAPAMISLPCKYKVGANVLDVYYNGELLLLSSNENGTDGHYLEVGDIGTISNIIRTTSDWGLDQGDYLALIVRGEYE